jgi:hypothetical protein
VTLNLSHGRHCGGQAAEIQTTTVCLSHVHSWEDAVDVIEMVAYLVDEIPSPIAYRCPQHLGMPGIAAIPEVGKAEYPGFLLSQE